MMTTTRTVIGSLAMLSLLVINRFVGIWDRKYRERPEQLQMVFS